jgi:hypothetical protein
MISLKATYAKLAKCPQSHIRIYRNVAVALNVAARDSEMAVLADNCIVVCRGRFASRLVKAGYSYA